MADGPASMCSSSREITAGSGSGWFLSRQPRGSINAWVLSTPANEYLPACPVDRCSPHIFSVCRPDPSDSDSLDDRILSQYRQNRSGTDAYRPSPTVKAAPSDTVTALTGIGRLETFGASDTAQRPQMMPVTLRSSLRAGGPRSAKTRGCCVSRELRLAHERGFR